jgi:hypothetical protein
LMDQRNADQTKAAAVGTGAFRKAEEIQNLSGWMDQRI